MTNSLRTAKACSHKLRTGAMRLLLRTGPSGAHYLVAEEEVPDVLVYPLLLGESSTTVRSKMTMS